MPGDNHQKIAKGILGHGLPRSNSHTQPGNLYSDVMAMM
jgi:hypothetical protein